MDANWFETWFNTPYYHILYKHRDEEEARTFIDNLVKYLQIKPPAKVLDIACGKGRHATYLHDKGFDVTGFDLSEQNIEEAKKLEAKGLAFYVNDIRNVQQPNEFDFALNLFTSFGYFDREDENFTALNAMCHNLKKDGILVIDFLNTNYVMNNLVPESVNELEGINFTSKRYVEEGWVIKDIEVNDHGEILHFKEKVKLIDHATFVKWLETAGMKIVDTFGNYKLEPYNETGSKRLIIIAKKQ